MISVVPIYKVTRLFRASKVYSIMDKIAYTMQSPFLPLKQRDVLACQLCASTFGIFWENVSKLLEYYNSTHSQPT